MILTPKRCHSVAINNWGPLVFELFLQTYRTLQENVTEYSNYNSYFLQKRTLQISNPIQFSSRFLLNDIADLSNLAKPNKFHKSTLNQFITKSILGFWFNHVEKWLDNRLLREFFKVLMKVDYRLDKKHLMTLQLENKTLVWWPWLFEQTKRNQFILVNPTVWTQSKPSTKSPAELHWIITNEENLPVLRTGNTHELRFSVKISFSRTFLWNTFTFTYKTFSSKGKKYRSFFSCCLNAPKVVDTKQTSLF